MEGETVILDGPMLRRWSPLWLWLDRYGKKHTRLIIAYRCVLRLLPYPMQ